MLTKKPYLLTFKAIGEINIGYISIAQHLEEIPFPIQRVYWTYYTPQNVIRGGHANINKELVLVSVAGSIIVETETLEGIKDRFYLDMPSKGLYIPPLCWHTMQYSHNAVQLVIASNNYDPNDYIRDYLLFKQHNLV